MSNSFKLEGLNVRGCSRTVQRDTQSPTSGSVRVEYMLFFHTVAGEVLLPVSVSFSSLPS